MISIASTQWRIQGRGPAPSPLFLDHTEAQRAKIFFWETSPPLSKRLDDRLPHYLKV